MKQSKQLITIHFYNRELYESTIKHVKNNQIEWYNTYLWIIHYNNKDKMIIQLNNINYFKFFGSYMENLCTNITNSIVCLNYSIENKFSIETVEKTKKDNPSNNYIKYYKKTDYYSLWNISLENNLLTN